jgi:hypothetical protein
MPAIPLLIADFEFEDISFSWQKVSPGMREALAVFGALIFITLLLLLWAAFVRRRGRRSAHRRYHSSRDIITIPSAAATAGGPGKTAPAAGSGVVKKRRRRRLPTNPTLAQTGGLPPIRTEDSSQTSS